MVSINNSLVAIEVRTEVFDCPNYSQCFQFCYPIVPLLFGKGATGERHRMELLVPLLLRKDGSQSFLAGISHDDERLGKVWIGQHRCVCQALPQLLEGLLAALSHWKGTPCLVSAWRGPAIFEKPGTNFR